MSLISVLPSPLLSLFFFPSSLSPHPLLYLFKLLRQSFISVSPAVCWSSILPLSEGEQNEKKGLQWEQWESQSRPFGLIEHIFYSSPLLCPKTLLWPILSPLPPAAHCLRWGVIFKTRCIPRHNTRKRDYTQTHPKYRLIFFFWHCFSIKLQIFKSLLVKKKIKTQRKLSSESHPSCSLPDFWLNSFLFFTLQQYKVMLDSPTA